MENPGFPCLARKSYAAAKAVLGNLPVNMPVWGSPGFPEKTRRSTRDRGFLTVLRVFALLQRGMPKTIKRVSGSSRKGSVPFKTFPAGPDKQGVIPEQAAMNSIHRLVFAAAIGLGASAGAAWEGEVTAVLEGDVIEITSPDGRIQVRLEGIDCPEKGQEYSKISKRFTSRTALRAMVQVEETGHDGAFTVARVQLSRGRSLAEELVRSGMAWWDRINYPGNTALAALEREARDRYAGLWGDDDPEAPWEYRRRQSAAPIDQDNPLDPAVPSLEGYLPPSSALLREASAEIPIIKPSRLR